MSTIIEQGSGTDSKIANLNSVAADTRSLTMRLDPKRLGLAFGATGVVFYLGCMLTMATVSREKAVIFFNSLLHGVNVGPILRDGVPIGEALLGLITTFILGWFAGVLIGGFYNLALQVRRGSGLE